ncbi:Mu transposase C-terminal domain-containing protein [Leptolyngbya ohadii]|uniref:Mu transposase C-terminal domain-containing protein n=1 Tax=Leptolyngbya ohadii TaxID=1962290 RepID=UPI001CEDA858|nr:Mu transposase C-terminal domain-containing protein [Leptolyngbya ohadii]
MDPATELISVSPAAPGMQLALRLPTPDTDDSWLIVDGSSELPDYVQQRMRIIQQLLAARGTKTYTQVQRQAARSLGMSVRSLRRLVKAWQELGVAGLSRQPRSDQGSIKASQEWQDFIVKTYKDGNRGSRQMSPAQVAVQVQARAQTLGVEDYPGRTTVYRILRPYIEKVQQKRSLGWRQDRLTLHTREGLAIAIEWSNQVWQVDHTRADVLVVDQSGEVLGRPWLTIVVDTYSRCIMGIYLGFDAPSSAVVCLALRHAIMPKQYSSAYELQGNWGTYGLPQYLYTDGGKDFRSQHLEQVATELGIVLCLRRKPSDGGIVERPFGTFNTQFFSTLPGYVSSNVETRSPAAESEACLTLMQLEQMLVRYIVDHYNPAVDARMGDQSRIGRWEAGRIAQLPLLVDRELDLCLMRRDQRKVYRSGYIQFANLTYQGEHLAAYAGESVILRYDPRDITTVLVYQGKGSKEEFLTRAHAQGWETETLSYAEAQAISERKREAGRAISNRTMLEEVRDRETRIRKLQKQQKQQENVSVTPDVAVIDVLAVQVNATVTEPIVQPEPEVEVEKPKKPVPYVRVVDYEELKRGAGLL